jgi:hypothetical protein
MENRIKEQFSLFAGRVSAESMRANQLRVYSRPWAMFCCRGCGGWDWQGPSWPRRNAPRCDGNCSRLAPSSASVCAAFTSCWPAAIPIKTCFGAFTYACRPYPCEPKKLSRKKIFHQGRRQGRFSFSPRLSTGMDPAGNLLQTRNTASNHQPRRFMLNSTPRSRNLKVCEKSGLTGRDSYTLRPYT